MASTLVDRVEFEQRLLGELQRRFAELHAEGAVEKAGGLRSRRRAPWTPKTHLDANDLAGYGAPRGACRKIC